MKQQHNNTHTTQWNVHEIVLLIAIPAIVLIAALSIGRYPVSINSLASALTAHLSGQPMDASQLALIRVRMPRVLIAMIIGASLSASGAAFQGLFKTPSCRPICWEHHLAHPLVPRSLSYWEQALLALSFHHSSSA